MAPPWDSTILLGYSEKGNIFDRRLAFVTAFPYYIYIIMGIFAVLLKSKYPYYHLYLLQYTPT